MPNDYISPAEIQQLILWRQECERLAEEDRLQIAEEQNRYHCVTDWENDPDPMEV